MREDAFVKELSTLGPSKMIKMQQGSNLVESLSGSTDYLSVFDDDEAFDDDDALLFFDSVLPKEPLDVNPEDIDAMVAQEMSALSMQDREKVFSDVHGVSTMVEESPELFHGSLQQLQLELEKLEEGMAYQVAMEMDPNFVQNESFQLMFLRADLFDASKAATRIALHFEMKLELFGKELLTTMITQDHLDEESPLVLYSGKIRLMEERDSSGRALFLNFIQAADSSVSAKLKASFYLAMLAPFDEDTQRRGCVAISFTVGQKMGLFDLSPNRREWNFKAALLCAATPVRFDGIHICHDSLAARVLFALFKFGGTKETRLRIREHFGNRQECLFKLQTFGIPTEAFPMDRNGKILIERHKEILEKRRKLEQFVQRNKGNALQEVRVGVPRRNDVLFGRGKAYYRHFGNLRLRAMVEEISPAYERANIAGKQSIREEVMTAVHQSNGRFLKDDGMCWVEVPDLIAGQKVSHAFRTLRGLKFAASSTDDSPTGKHGHVLKRGRADS